MSLQSGIACSTENQTLCACPSLKLADSASCSVRDTGIEQGIKLFHLIGPVSTNNHVVRRDFITNVRDLLDCSAEYGVRTRLIVE